MGEQVDVRAGRLRPEEYRRNFDELHPPLDRKRALVDAARCYFCHDAPCVEACPTGIDIPRFIRGIQTDNVRGAALTILEANILGGSCARVCPTEVLCEGACVRKAQEGEPVRIGLLQRYATDWLLDRGEQPFARAAPTGKRVAVVGAGPAGLACAHALARLGHAVTILEKRAKSGGLNEYGIAAYKVPHGFAQAEVDFVLSLGGIEVRHGVELGREVHLHDLRRDYDAVFVGCGLQGMNALGLPEERLEGVLDAVDYIAALRQAQDLSRLPVGRDVVVIGGGNTAVDIAIQARRLGAENVTIAYRRGPQQMGATGLGAGAGPGQRRARSATGRCRPGSSARTARCGRSSWSARARRAAASPARASGSRFPPTRCSRPSASFWSRPSSTARPSCSRSRAARSWSTASGAPR